MDMTNDDTFDNETDASSTIGMSFALEPGKNRRYYRCFKVNLCLNISMLITFVCLITFGPWYSMKYRDNNLSLDANFSLIILATE